MTDRRLIGFATLRRWLRHAVALCVLILAASACKPAPPKMLGGNITAYNHTGDYIHQYYVDGQWGGNSFAYGGGGSFVCCAQYPAQWHEGLTAKVRWTTSSSNPKATGDEAEEHWHEKVVPIERYTKEGRMNVHFLPGGEVRLIVSSKAAGHPEYPGPPYPEEPPGWPPWNPPTPVSPDLIPKPRPPAADAKP